MPWRSPSSPACPPDETTHLGKARAFAHALWVPPDSPETYPLGPIARQPNLYYLLTGNLLRLEPAAIGDLLWLRLWNVVLGLWTAIYAWRVAGYLCDDRLSRGFALLLVTNTLMFTAISAAVSYDNLANLLAAAATYHLLDYFARGQARALIWLASTLTLGCLTKTAFLPLAFLLVVSLLARERRRLGALAAGLGRELRPTSVSAATRALALLTLVGFAVELYGGNLVRYRRLSPSRVELLGLEAALQNRVFARDYAVAAYRRGELDWSQALAVADRIEHPGDRATARSLLQTARMEHQPGVVPQRIDAITYAAHWAQLMLQRTVGYTGHALLMKSPLELAPYVVLLAAAAVIFIRRFQPTDAGGRVGWAALIAAGYAAVLMWLVNYPAYLRSNSPGVGLQGRYLFLVLAPAWVLTARSLLAPWPPRARWLLAAVAGAYLVYGDLPWLLSHADPAWFGR